MNIHEPKLTKRHLDRKVTIAFFFFHHSFLNRVLLKLPQVLSSPVVLVSAMLKQGEHRCADLQNGSLPPEPSKCLSVTPNTAVL